MGRPYSRLGRLTAAAPSPQSKEAETAVVEAAEAQMPQGSPDIQILVPPVSHTVLP
eukprot:CAMPEP_0171596240 /NCGR_PEP_ID=MMETSP0990-20121206/1813_1 /TAXON_ID=483369 /ORGANISM="non described non described, Strain CCMP2098" /LENGTH=55 /DNA_ID=CAMNT_0012157375 /DNA_START=206 /DNA_END=373 /DNA_ORIENTATION=-